MSKVAGKKCVQCFRVLSAATRVRIVRDLQDHEATVTEITERMGVTQPTVSYHLRLLEDIGLVGHEKNGRETMYSFNKKYPCKGCGVFGAEIKI